MACPGPWPLPPGAAGPGLPGHLDPGPHPEASDSYTRWFLKLAFLLPTVQAPIMMTDPNRRPDRNRPAVEIDHGIDAEARARAR